MAKETKVCKASSSLFLIPLSLSPRGSWGCGETGLPAAATTVTGFRAPTPGSVLFVAWNLLLQQQRPVSPCLRRVPTHSHSGDSTGLSLRVERKQTPSSWRVIQSKGLVTGLCYLRISETPHLIRPKTLAERPEE